MRKLIGFFGVLVAGGAGAMSIVSPENLGVLAQEAPLVALARAEGEQSWLRSPLVFTRVRFRVLELVKGPKLDEVVVEVPGGALADKSLVVPGAPRFRRG
ncbi:MAG: hypothetical protein NZ869_05990 [Thermoanaerobaculum sp.]|nr:hypothetical protein [Thermoanaerobaculum sp.]MDW7967471.1 hypothetical protein [Thermoanaerobaculum sp.]